MKRYIWGAFKFLLQRNISIFSIIDGCCNISREAAVYRGTKLVNTSIGKYSYISPNCEIVNTKIGNYTSIANGCAIGLGIHTNSYISTSPVFTQKYNGTGAQWINENCVNPLDFSIQIGNDVWIGARVIIVGNISIGDGAIVGTGAVVTKDIPPYAVVGGVPAKIIKYRFDEVIIDKLLNINWWNLPKNKLERNIKLFQKEYFSIEELNNFL